MSGYGQIVGGNKSGDGYYSNGTAATSVSAWRSSNGEALCGGGGNNGNGHSNIYNYVIGGHGGIGGGGGSGRNSMSNSYSFGGRGGDGIVLFQYLS